MVLHIEAVLGRALGERAVAAIVQQHVPTLAPGNVQVVVPIGVNIHDADAGMAVKCLAGEVAMRRDKRGVEKRLAHQFGVARKPSPGAVLVARERLIENFGKQRVLPREHLQRFGLPALNPPRGIFLPLPVERQPSQYLRSLPVFCLRRSVEAQAGLVECRLRVEEMPGLNVEGRIVAGMHLSQERSP